MNARTHSTIGCTLLFIYLIIYLTRTTKVHRITQTQIGKHAYARYILLYREVKTNNKHLKKKNSSTNQNIQ